MFKKIICSGLIFLMLFSLCSCKKETKEGFSIDHFSVTVKAEYREKFLAKDFKAEDYRWDNVKEIAYEAWYDESSRGFLTVYLDKQGKAHVLAAIEHFKTLEFVEDAETIGYGSLY